MNNYLLPLSIIIAAIIIAFGMGHLASEIRIAQMCDDVKTTMSADVQFVNKELSYEEMQIKYANLCVYKERKLLPRLF